MDYDVGIIYQERPVKLLKIGFFHNGFFITDFLSLGSKVLNEKAAAFKIKVHQLNHGVAKRRGYLFRQLSHLPKYSHHNDGFAQFSSEGLVISGKDKITGKPNGLGTKSFPLTKKNDGGPFAGLLIWGIENLPIFTPDATAQRIWADTLFENDLLGSREPNALKIEFLYTLKKETINPENSIFLNYHLSATEKRLVQILPTPASFAGQICVCMSPDWADFNSEYGFTFYGWPTKANKQNFSEELVLIYPDPFKGNFKGKEIESIDLTDISKIKFHSRDNLKDII